MIQPLHVIFQLCDLYFKKKEKKEAKKEKHLNMKHDTLAALIYSKEGCQSKFIKNVVT